MRLLVILTPTDKWGTNIFELLQKYLCEWYKIERQQKNIIAELKSMHQGQESLDFYD